MRPSDNRPAARGRVASIVLAGVLLLLLALPAAAAALPPQYQWAWTQPYVYVPPVPGSFDVPLFHHLAVGPSGSVYASTGPEGDHWVIARVASDGSEAWTTQPSLGPGGKAPVLYALTSDAARNAVAVGGAGSEGTRDILLVRVSAKGTARQKTWDGSAHGDDVAVAVATDARNNIYAAGMTGAAGGLPDGVLLKFSSRGVLRWKYRYASAKIDYFSGVALDKDGNVYVAGPADAEKDGSGALLVSKVSPKGRRLWQRKVRTPGLIYDVTEVVVKGTGVYVAGMVIQGKAYTMAAGLSTRGKVKWVYRATDQPAIRSVGGMAVDPNGRTVIAMTAKGYSAADPSLETGVVWVLSPKGKLYRRAVLEGTFDPAAPRDATVQDVVVDRKGRIFCAGYLSTSNSGSEGNAAVFSLPPASSTTAAAWAADRVWRYDSPASGSSDEFSGAVIAGGRVYVAGARTVPGAVPEQSQPIVDRLSMAPAMH